MPPEMGFEVIDAGDPEFRSDSTDMNLSRAGLDGVHGRGDVVALRMNEYHYRKMREEKEALAARRRSDGATQYENRPQALSLAERYNRPIAFRGPQHGFEGTNY